MRIWKSNLEDDGSIHAIGNGDMLVYGQGPNIENIYGPPYSAPSFLSMNLTAGNTELKSESVRIKNTAVWEHTIYNKESLCAKIIDFMLPDQNVFIREFDIHSHIEFCLKPSKVTNTHILKEYFKYLEICGDTVLLVIPKGSAFFTGDTIGCELDIMVTLLGNARLSKNADGNIIISLGAGKTRMLFSSGYSMPEVVSQSEALIKADTMKLIKKTKEFWNRFSLRRHDFTGMLDEKYPYKEKILDAIDSVSVLVKCQQSRSGGVSAGPLYNMAYVRDQSGVLRGLLALGYFEEAKAILLFWLKKWNLFGNLFNAEGMGNNGARLFFTNDEVEIPAYLILNCFIYASYTKDKQILIEMFPMMLWAFEVQLGHLAGGMLEFSCDETYIAGGAFPKHLMYHGSAEATLLFITGGEAFLAFAGENRLLQEEKLCEYNDRVSYAKKQYKYNFMNNGLLCANSPLREKLAGKPRFRFGFCEAHEIHENILTLSWTERNAQGYYVCPECMRLEMKEFEHGDKRYVLNSVSLLPLYAGSDMFDSQEIEKILKPSIEIFNATGRVPSNIEGQRSLGYDYGLMLYNMVKLKHPLKEQVLQKTLSLLDSTGAWVEYYDGDSPFHCRCRAWESAINIEGVVAYIKSCNASESSKNR